MTGTPATELTGNLTQSNFKYHSLIAFLLGLARSPCSLLSFFHWAKKYNGDSGARSLIDAEHIRLHRKQLGTLCNTRLEPTAMCSSRRVSFYSSVGFSQPVKMSLLFGSKSVHVPLEVRFGAEMARTRRALEHRFF